MKLQTLKTILQEHRYHQTVAISFVVYFLLYLYATQLLVFTPEGPLFDLQFFPNWTTLVFQQRSTFLFESIGVIQITPYIQVFLSIVSMLIAAVLSYLVGLNVAVSYFVFRKVGWRGYKGMASMIATVPALLGGAACCVPTLIIVLGLQFTATLSTIWPWFVPISFLLLVVSLWWALSQAEKHPGICTPPSSKKLRA